MYDGNNEFRPKFDLPFWWKLRKTNITTYIVLSELDWFVRLKT